MTREMDATTAPTPRATLTVEETAHILGIGRTSAYEAAQRGEIPAIRVGRRLLVLRARLMALLGDDGPATSSGHAEERD